MKLHQWARLQESKHVIKVELNDVKTIANELTDRELVGLLLGALEPMLEGLGEMENALSSSDNLFA